jgi:hypothetical protein
MPYLTSLPVLQLRHDALLLYYEPQYSLSLSAKWKQQKLSNFKEKKNYSGAVTLHTRKRISKAVTLMSQASEKKIIFNPITNRKEKFQFNFITLTISKFEKHLTPKEAYPIIFKPFLQWLTKSKNVNTYIWKSELQKNGQLHYHIVTNTWIHWKEIRNKWNYLLSKNGLLDNYIKNHNHANANSTDVHRVHHVKSMSRYLHKELSKSIQNSTATRGKIWDCSTNLKGEKYFLVPFDVEHEKLLMKADKKVKLTEIGNTQYTLIKAPEELTKYLLTKDEQIEFEKYILKIRRQKNILL